MVVKVAGVGRSFAGVAAYCLHDRREPGEPQPETSERVEWTDTRNLPTSRGDRAAAVMAAPELKRMAGGSAVGRKLEKPVLPLLAELGSGRGAGPAGDEPGGGREPESARAGEAPGADRGTRPLRSRCASDRRPVGRSESAAEGSSDDEALRELSPPALWAINEEAGPSRAELEDLEPDPKS